MIFVFVGVPSIPLSLVFYEATEGQEEPFLALYHPLNRAFFPTPFFALAASWVPVSGFFFSRFVYPFTGLPHYRLFFRPPQ